MDFKPMAADELDGERLKGRPPAQCLQNAVETFSSHALILIATASARHLLLATGRATQ
jgi:hypothetical protein